MCQTFLALQIMVACGYPCTAAATFPALLHGWGAPHSPCLCLAGCKSSSQHFVSPLAKNTQCFVYVLWEQSHFSPPAEGKPPRIPATHLVGSTHIVPWQQGTMHDPSANLCLSVCCPLSWGKHSPPWGVCFRACLILAGTKMWS